MVKDAKLNLRALRAAGDAARERIQQLSAWEKDAIQVVSSAASSSESRQVLLKAKPNSQKDTALLVVDRMTQSTSIVGK